MHLDTMRNYWLPIALASSVEFRPKQFRLLGETIVAYRDSGGPVAFKDMCGHRGAAVSNGRLAGGNLICPYHGWQYDRSGACVSIPSLTPGQKIPSRAKLVRYQVKEAYGLIWVCMSAAQARLAMRTWQDTQSAPPVRGSTGVGQDYVCGSAGGRTESSVVRHSP